MGKWSEKFSEKASSTAPTKPPKDPLDSFVSAQPECFQKNAPAGRKARIAFYNNVLGPEPYAIATLPQEQVNAALGIGLLPKFTAGVIYLAYRNSGAQGLLQIPEEKYDGLAILELFDQHTPREEMH